MKTIIVLLCALALSACVRTSVAMLDQNTVVISARGSAFDSMGGVIQGTMVRAANVTVSRGYRYFVIVSGADASRKGAIYIPGQTYESGRATFSGNTATYSGSTYTTPGTTTTFIKPGAEVIVRMYREGEIDPKAPGVWDAQSVIAAQPK